MVKKKQQQQKKSLPSVRSSVITMKTSPVSARTHLSHRERERETLPHTEVPRAQTGHGKPAVRCSAREPRSAAPTPFTPQRRIPLRSAPLLLSPPLLSSSTPARARACSCSLPPQPSPCVRTPSSAEHVTLHCVAR